MHSVLFPDSAIGVGALEPTDEMISSQALLTVTVSGSEADAMSTGLPSGWARSDVESATSFAREISSYVGSATSPSV